MKSWKAEQALLKEKVIKTPSGYKATRTDFNYLKGYAETCYDCLLDLAKIATGRSDKKFDIEKEVFESMLKDYYYALDEMRR